jgi:hypothetical protein
MSTDIDVPVGSDPQEPGSEFPGHCDFCGEPCEVCAARADDRSLADNY